MGTASDGVVYPNTSAIQLHPIGLGFGLGRGEERRGRICPLHPSHSHSLHTVTHVHGVIHVLEVNKGKTSRASSLQERQAPPLNTDTDMHVHTHTPHTHTTHKHTGTQAHCPTHLPLVHGVLPTQTTTAALPLTLAAYNTALVRWQ